jgi:hypothetical protein
MRQIPVMLTILLAFGSAGLQAALIVDNYGAGPLDSAVASETNLGSGQSWVAEDFAVGETPLVFNQVRWLARVSVPDGLLAAPTFEVIILTRASDGTFTEEQLVTVDGADAAFVATEDAGLHEGQAWIGDTTLAAETHYYIGARLVGQGLGSHEVVAIDGASPVGAHDQTPAAMKLEFGYEWPWALIDGDPYYATDTTEFAYQLHDVIPEPATLLLAAALALPVLRRR